VALNLAETTRDPVALIIQPGSVLEGTTESVALVSKADRTMRFISTLTGEFESLAFPLLFPGGSANCWTQSDSTRIGTVQKYVRQRLLGDPLLHCIGLLASEWLLTQYSRMEDCRLEFLRSHQTRLIRQDELLMARLDANVEQIGKKFLPSSHVGSPGYWLNACVNGQHLAVELGMPTFLITMTCNPNWPEIVALVDLYGCACARRQFVFTEHPDLVARVFHDKMLALLRFLRTSETLGSIIGHIWKVEFQKRGLPHVHVLLYGPLFEMLSKICGQLMSLSRQGCHETHWMQH